MKRIVALVLSILLWTGMAAAVTFPPSPPYIIQVSDCTILTWLGTICQDTDDGKMYKWTGAALVEIAGTTIVGTNDGYCAVYSTANARWEATVCPGAGGGASDTSSFVTFEDQPLLSGDRVLTEAAGIDLSTAVAGQLRINVDLTELVNQTWGAGEASSTHTFNVSGTTDPVWTYSDGVANLSAGTLQQGGIAAQLQGADIVAAAGNNVFTIDADVDSTDTLVLRAYDVGSGWDNLITLTSSATPTIALAADGAITISSAVSTTVESVVFTDGAISSVTSITDGTASWTGASLSGFADITLTDDLTVGDDLLLASGAVISWDTTDITLTHSANTLTLAGGDLALGAGNLTLTGYIASGANPADAGALRLSNNTNIAWEIAATGTDTTFGVNASDDMVAALVAATDIFQITTGNLQVGAGTKTQTFDGADAYITGFLEVDGMIYADGGITGALTGAASSNILKSALVAKGDLITASAASTPAVITDVAAGQPLLSGGIGELPAYAGYTFSGTGAATYTFPGATSTLARTDAGQTFTGVNIFTAPTITTSIAPTVAGASTLGTASVEWGNVYLTDGAIIYGQIDGSATLTSSASLWTANNFGVTTQFKLPSSDADPTATAGYLRHDSTIANFTGGGLVYYNGAAIKQVVDMTTATAQACTEAQVIVYDATADLWKCADAPAADADIVAIAALTVAQGKIIIGSASPAWSLSAYTFPIVACTENQILKADGSGNLVCGADADTGGATALDDIGDPDGATSITLADTETITILSSSDGETVLTIKNDDADLAGVTSFIDLIYKDDGQANGFFIRGYDNDDGTPDLKFSIGADGAATFGVVTASFTGALTGNADTATLASTVTVVDSTDASSYVLIVDLATGSLAVKTDTGLTYAADTGILTATGFAGPLTGAVTGNASTATLAATSTIVDSTDASSYVVIVDSATGSLALKTDTGITYAADTGILTATGFSGPINGTIGATTPAAGAFTTVTSTVTGATLYTGTLINTTAGTSADPAMGMTVTSSGAKTGAGKVYGNLTQLTALDGATAPGGYYGMVGHVYSRSGEAVGDTAYGLYGSVQTEAGGDVAPKLANAIGLYGEARSTLGTITDAYGIKAYLGASSGATVTAGDGIWIDVVNAGTFTTARGLSIPAFVGTYTTKYGAVIGERVYIDTPAGETNPTLWVSQKGTGDIIQLADNDVVKWKLLDGGNIYHGVIDVTNYNYLKIAPAAIDGTAHTISAETGGTGADNVNITLTPAGTGQVIISSDLTISGGNINTGNIALVIGDATTDSITFTTDGTGTAEIVFPNEAIGKAEIQWGTDPGVDMDAIPNSATFEKVAADDVENAHVMRLYDDDETGSITITGLSTGRLITFQDAAQTVANLGGIQTFSGAKTFSSPLILNYGATDSGTIQFYEDSSNGSNYMTFKGPATLADDTVTVTIPALTGTVMVTGNSNGDGFIFGDTYPPDAQGEIGTNGTLVQFYNTAARTFMFLETAQTISGVLEIADDTNFDFGTGSVAAEQYHVSFDQTNNQFKIATSAISAAAVGTPMINFQVNSGGGTLTEDQVVFQITNNATSLLSLTEDGDLVVAGSITSAASNNPYLLLNETDGTDWYVGVDDTGNTLEFRTNATVGNSVQLELGENGNLTVTGDLTVSGGDIVMADNTAGKILIGDDTNFTPTAVGGHATLASNGSLTVTNFDITGTEAIGSLAVYSGSAWQVLTTGATAGHVLTSQGTGSLPTYAAVSASAGGSATHIQYNTGGSLDGEAAFYYTAANNTLNITQTSTNPTIQTGDNVYSWTQTPIIGAEGVVESTTAFAVGADPADAGAIRLSNAAAIVWEDAVEASITHVDNTGWTFKAGLTTDDSPIKIVFQTAETDMAVNDVLGGIYFQAPDEASGTDAILVAAGIEAVSEGDFSATSNATKLSFKTGASETATEKMSLSSVGVLTVSGDTTITGGDITLISATAGAGITGGDGTISLKGLGSGTDEIMTIDLNSANLITFASTTDATFAFTPAVAFNGGISGTLTGTASNVANADYGEVTVAAGVWSVDSGSILLNELGNPGVSTSLTMGANTLTFTSATDGWAGVTISNTAAENVSETYLLNLTFTDTAPDASMNYIKMASNAGAQTDFIFDGGKGLIVGDTMYVWIGASGVPGQTINGEDLYVKGISEFDGMMYADGGVTGALTGNSSTASALAADPANCSAGQIALGVTAAGVAECTATPTATSLALGADPAETGALMLAAGAAIGWEGTTEVTLTNVAQTGLLLNSSMQLQFGDSGTYINQSTDGTLNIVADTIAQIVAPNIKLAFDSAAYLNVAVADGGAATLSVVSDDAVADILNVGDNSDDQPRVRMTNDATNETWSGNTIYFAQCAATMGFGQPAYIQSTGKPGLANAAAAATMPAIGLVVVASTDADTPCTILTHGVLTDTDWNWTPGGTIYVDDSAAGVLTATVEDIAGTDHVVQIMGIAIHADSILVNPTLFTITLE